MNKSLRLVPGCICALALYLSFYLPCFGQLKNLGVGDPMVSGSATIPILNYTVIDVSGTSTSTAVTDVALDDANNFAFGFPTGSDGYGGPASYQPYKLQNGTASKLQPFPLFSTDPKINVLFYPQSGSTDFWELNASGSVCGKTGAKPDNQWFYTAGFASGGIVGAIYPPVPPYLQDNNSQALVEAAEGDGIYAGSYSGDIATSGTIKFINSEFIATAGKVAIFGSEMAGVSVPPNITVVNTNFKPILLNSLGQGVGNVNGGDKYFFWDGSQISSNSFPDNPKAMNNNGQVIAGGGANSYVWSVAKGTQYITQLIPPAYLGQVNEGSISLIDIGGTNSSGNSSILFSALYQSGTDSGQNRTFLLTLTSTGNVLQLVSLPQGVTLPSSSILNAGGLIAGIGTPAGGTGNHALLLMPVQYQQVNPNSGMDWVSQPNWLMVPAGGNNQANAITAASSNFTINFSIQPNSSSSQLTVSPTSTTSSNQTITVTSSGTNTGESYQVQAGIGTTSSGTNSAGLCIDVKPRTTGTITIHAVTQHYVTATGTALPQGWTPNTVCVNLASVGPYTTAGGDDVYDDHANTINTGPNGVCETHADPHDTQVIPFGWGIPKDIAPKDIPSASSLQTYLNQVYGLQANLYFSVTRSDFTMNYDLNNNGVLDISAYISYQTKEEDSVDAHADPNAQFNIFYVQDYQELLLSGTTLKATHSSLGATNSKTHITFVRDQSNILRTTAHEVGHLRNLNHTDDDALPSGAINPASAIKVPDPFPLDRIMYPDSSGTGTRIIQPEWDIVNHNPGIQ